MRMAKMKNIDHVDMSVLRTQPVSAKSIKVGDRIVERGFLKYRIKVDLERAQSGHGWTLLADAYNRMVNEHTCRASPG